MVEMEVLWKKQYHIGFQGTDWKNLYEIHMCNMSNLELQVDIVQLIL